MSTDIARRAQWNGGARRPDKPLPEPQISAAAKERDDLDNRQFEKQAADFLKPTTLRPALVAADEVEYFRTTLRSGAGRLDALVKLTGRRLDYWNQQQGGGEPFDPITPEQAEKASAFFSKYGVRLADEKPVAPPNPIKAKQEADKPSTAAAPAPAPRPASPAVDVPGVARAVMPPPASADIEFILESGYHCSLHVAAPSWSGVLEQVGQISARLVKMNAKPAPAVVASAAAAAPRASGEPPKCKYHGVTMKESKKPGTFFCPKKIEGGGYCDYSVTV